MFSFEIFKPFVSAVWIAFIVLIFIITNLLHFFSKYECHEFKLISSFLLSFGAFCQQGTIHKINLISTRCLILFLFFAGTLTYNFYTSILVSHLVDVKYESSVNNMDDLIENDVSIGFFDSATVRNFLKVCRKSIFESLERFLIFFINFQGNTEPEDILFIQKKILDTGRDKESFYMNPTEGFQKVKDGHFAFFCEEPTANRFIRKIFEPHEICDTRKVSFKRNDLVGIVVNKLSPLRERFLINFLWMAEVGIEHKVYHYWNDMDLTCTTHGHFESVRLEYLAPIFGFLLFAYVLSIIILLIETFIMK